MPSSLVDRRTLIFGTLAAGLLPAGALMAQTGQLTAREVFRQIKAATGQPWDPNPTDDRIIFGDRNVPVTGIARDDATGQLYASTDFGVLTTTDGKSGKWQLAAAGMPMVEVAGITIDSAHRVMYAATHGRAIWSLQLPDAKSSGKH